MERHPQQPHHALGRGDRPGQVFRKPSNFANGNTRDRQGRLLTCEHDTRRVSRTEYDGTIVAIADKFDGKPLNSPNDIVVKSDDSIWFTDPPFGILGNYEGHTATPELPTNVYRVDGSTGQITVAAGDINRPNGLASRPTSRSSMSSSRAVTPRGIHVFDVVGDGTRLANGRPFIMARRAARPTGFASTSTAICGAAGEWATPARRRVQCSLRPPHRSANRPAGALRQPCFGGVAIATGCSWSASHSLYSLYVNTQGVKGG